MASNALPETLRSVTSTKIKELKKQRRQFEASKNAALQSAHDATNRLEETRLLLDGICRLEGVRVVDDDSSDSDGGAIATDAQRRRRNQQLFLLQARKDPAFSSSLVDDIQSDILKDLELKSIQHEHAQFFSELVTEWLSDSPDSLPTQPDVKPTGDSAFESIGRKEMHEQRAQWESIVFSQCQTDELEVAAYLEKLFNTDMVVSHALKTVRESTVRTCETFQFDREYFNADELMNTVQGVLETDLLSPEKANILKSFKTNPDVLQEVADVLNMRFASLHTWEWTTTKGAISVEQRRQLNGKYRVFMDEDVLDALLLHAIGMKFAVHFKACLTSFFTSPAWKSATRQISKVDRERREYFLGTDYGSDSSSTVEAKRRALYKSEYFLTQLPVSESEGIRGYGDEDGDRSDSNRKSPVETKQSLLHLLVTESVITRHLRPGASHAVIRSDFQWFGPSLPHETISACLKFFGVTDHWLQFFGKFLAAPMRFIQDGPDGQVQVRSRGVPMSHALSDVFGEVILFAMGFAVNSATSSYLYRLHDDFWFWGDEALCVRAWDSMTAFASVMGIGFNKEKTGTVIFDQGSISRQTEDSDSDSDDSDSDVDGSVATKSGLPRGEVRWGFLKLDAISGQFVIDQSMVDEHIQELKRQLEHCSSIFSYIQAFNAYLARFFSNNFGKPSIAFGRAHVDNMIDTFTRIEKAIFPNQSITDHLNKLAAERFGVHGIPDGVWYWPVQMGGMELQNPLVPLYCMREHLRSTPDRILKRALAQEELEYLSYKERFSKRSRTSSRTSRHSFGDTFMPRDEYLRYREERSDHLGAAFTSILAIPREFAVLETNEITAWLEELPVAPRGTKRTTSGISRHFRSMKPYWKWILAVYGSQIVDKYGSVQIVDAAQVPLGVVSVKKSSKVRWQG